MEAGNDRDADIDEGAHLGEATLAEIEDEFINVEQTLRMLDDPNLEPERAIDWLTRDVSPQARLDI